MAALKPKTRSHQSGFTLVELAGVLTVISILTYGLINVLQGRIDAAKEKRSIEELSIAANKFQLIYSQNGSTDFSGVDNAVVVDSRSFDGSLVRGEDAIVLPDGATVDFEPFTIDEADDHFSITISGLDSGSCSRYAKSLSGVYRRALVSSSVASPFVLVKDDEDASADTPLTTSNCADAEEPFIENDSRVRFIAG